MIKLLISFLFFIPVDSGSSEDIWSSEDKKRDAQIILDELFEVVGNKQLEKPDIQISNSTNSVASYSPYLNKIIIEEKAFDACAELGAKKKDALAFIIGHELGHGYQSTITGHTHETNFLAYDKCDQSNKSDESNADLFGCFTAYLAGYQIDEVVKKTLNSVYSLYGLNGKKLSNYPTLDERIQTSDVILEKVNELILLYELAPTLDLAGLHSASKSCYEQITEFYQGKEIYNNLGISFILEAINLSETNIDRFVYPFEFDAESRLKRPFGDVGGKNLEYEDQIVREVLLKKAIKQFSIALELDPNYEKAFANTIIAHSILGDENSLANIQSMAKKRNNYDSELVDLSINLAKLKLGNIKTKKKAQENLSSLMNSKNKSISQYAALNLAIYQDKYMTYNGTCNCQRDKFPSILPTLIRSGNSPSKIVLNASTHLEIVEVLKNNSYGLKKVIKFSHGGKKIFLGISDETIDSLCPKVQGKMCQFKKNEKLILNPIKNNIVYVSH